MKPSTSFLKNYKSVIAKVVEKEDFIQYLFKFGDKPIGASLIWLEYKFELPEGGYHSTGSYGFREGLWELVPVEWLANGDFKLIYHPKINPSDVLGYLDGRAVSKLLKRISSL